MHHHRKDLLDRPMTRREFIQQVGVGLFLVFGGGMISQFMSGFDNNHKAPTSTHNYGTRSYGG